MITLVLTNRNRELRIIKNCLDSLAEQSVREFNVILVDYGSDVGFVNELNQLVSQYHFTKLICCPVQAQLWNKSRAINIALRQCSTSHFLVGDIDMLCRADFIEKAMATQSNEKVVYFKVGFLSETESQKTVPFENYSVKHFSKKEATGITLFPTTVLKRIHGYDEFYHGWGAEDTDVHIRMLNEGLTVYFYEEAILVKHQWHPKAYRSIESTNPFHSKLERINHSYMQSTDILGRIRANLNAEWGKIPLELDYQRLLDKPDYAIAIKPIDVEVRAMLAQLKNFETELVHICINEVSLKEKMKQRLKKGLGKKNIVFWSMEDTNNSFLEEIIVNYRNLPYSYVFNREKREIQLLIQF